MKKLTLTLVALLLWASSLEAQIMLKTDKELEVGSNPVGVFAYEPPEYEEYPILNDTISIFCAGVDVNNNGIIDPEDEPPSWWKYNTKDTSSKAYKISDFEYFFVKPYNFTLNTAWGKYDVSTTFIGYDDKANTFLFGDYIDLEKNKVKYNLWSADNKLLFYYDRHNITAYIKEGDERDSIISSSPYPHLKQELIGKFIGFASTFGYRKHPNNGVYMANTILSILSVKDGDLWLEEYRGGNTTPVQIEKTKTEKIMDFNPETDTVTSLTNDLQMTIKSSDTNQVKYRFHHNLSENEKLLPYEEETPTYVAKLEDDITAIVTDDRNIVLKDLYNRRKGDIEMHRSEFEVGYIEKQLDYVFVASKYKNEKHTGKVAIYDFINNDDINYITEDWNYVGYQPVATFVSYDVNRNIYTICKGIDYNFNGKIEEELGDVAPSLWKSYLSYGGKFSPSEKVMDIGFKINLPMKTSISPDGNLLIPSGNNLIVFSREEEKIIEEIDLGMYVVSVDAIEDKGDIYYLCGLRDYSTGKSYARVISKTAEYDQSIETEPNIVDSKFQKYNLYNLVVTLNEGDYEDSKSNLEFILFHTAEVKKENNIELDGVGSKISLPNQSNRIYPIMTANHKIHIVDLDKEKLTATINTDTKGNGGPRDVEIGTNLESGYWLLFTSTYSDEIQMYDASDGKSYHRYNIKRTGYTGDVNYFDYYYTIIDNIQHKYNDPSNRIYLYNSQRTLAVDYDFGKINTPPIRIYPHPVANDFHLVSDELVGDLDIAIIDGQGKIVATHSAIADGEVAMSADELGLGAGNYTAVINGTKAVRFIVIK